MPVEYNEAETVQDSIDPGETVVAMHGDAILISDWSTDRDEVELSEIDGHPGRVRFLQIDEVEDEDRVYATDMVFEEFRTARLCFGLWAECGPFSQPESGNHVPISIAAAGKAHLAAYLRIGNGFPTSREYVAEKLDVTEQTVSNYWNRVRWKPGDETGE